jgi:hypothetical protein
MPEDKFYILPPTPDWLEGVPQLGLWQSPSKLPEEWAGRHFIEQFFATGKNRELEDHASGLRNGMRSQVRRDVVNAGGQHVLFKIEFGDRVIWLARIRFPQCPILDHKCVGGFRDYEVAMKSMESEIATMNYITTSTRVPVPKVFGYDLRTKNIGGPYILMEMVAGDTLELRMKIQGGIWKSQTERLLKQMTSVIAELSTIKFDGIGRLQFGETEASYNLVDYDDPFAQPVQDASQYLQAQINSTSDASNLNESLAELWNLWPKADDREKQSIAKLTYHQTAKQLMKDAHPGPFPLQHADINQQNVIVDEYCNVITIIDWERAGTRPYEIIDIHFKKLFNQPWQRWVELDWVEEYTLSSFTEMEPKVSAIVSHKIGCLARILHAPVNSFQFQEGLEGLVRFLYHNFYQEAKTIVPLVIAIKLLNSSL